MRNKYIYLVFIDLKVEFCSTVKHYIQDICYLMKFGDEYLIRIDYNLSYLIKAINSFNDV